MSSEMKQQEIAKNHEQEYEQNKSENEPEKPSNEQTDAEQIRNLVKHTASVVLGSLREPDPELEIAFNEIMERIQSHYIFLPPGPVGSLICQTCLRPY